MVTGMSANSSRWKIPAVIALAVGSYVAGTFHPREGKAGGQASGGTAQTGAALESGADSQVPATKTQRGASSRKTAGPIFGTPFAKGGARAWFIDASREGWGEDMAGFLSLFQVCGTLDEAAARELANELRDMCQQYRDGDATLREAIKDDDILKQGLASTVFRLSQVDPLGAIAFLQTADMPNKDDMFKMAFVNLAKQDPAKLLTELQNLKEGDLKDAAEGALEVLKKKDPEAAISLLEKLPSTELRKERSKLVGDLASKDPEGAIALATRLAGATGDAFLFGTVVEMWARKDDDAALVWAANYQGPGAVEAKKVMIQRIGEKDPLKAVAIMKGMADGGAAMGNSAAYVAGSYARQDLNAARGWVDGLPASEARTAAEESLVEVWLRSDPMQAAERIDKMPAGQPRDRSAMRLVDAIKGQYPQEAFEWAGSIQNQDQQKRAEQEVMQEWRKLDPAAAEAAWTARHGKQ